MIQVMKQNHSQLNLQKEIQTLWEYASSRDPFLCKYILVIGWWGREIMICFAGKDIEIALTEIRKMQQKIDNMADKERNNMQTIQTLLEEKNRYQR